MNPLKDEERTQLEWNRKAKDAINAIMRRLLGVGATTERPVSPTDGQMFYDQTRQMPSWFSAAAGVWLDAGGSNTVVTKTADFTMGPTESVAINNKSGSTCTVTLPSANDWPNGTILLKNLQAQTLVSASSNVAPIASATPGTAILPATAGAWALLCSTATNWVIMMRGT